MLPGRIDAKLQPSLWRVAADPNCRSSTLTEILERNLPQGLQVVVVLTRKYRHLCLILVSVFAV
jgi:hypothetical protein